jgi:hypothetical protein
MKARKKAKSRTAAHRESVLRVQSERIDDLYERLCDIESHESERGKFHLAELVTSSVSREVAEQIAASVKELKKLITQDSIYTRCCVCDTIVNRRTEALSARPGGDRMHPESKVFCLKCAKITPDWLKEEKKHSGL